jgi:bacteriorhodopsin
MIVANDSFTVIKLSFYITYVLLITTGTITFIESLRTNIPQVRHVMNLETCISIIAAFFYGKFLVMIEKPTTDYSEINYTRYADWFITTPLMLLVLCLVLAYNSGSKVRLHIYLSIIVLNFLMLWMGYLGEKKILRKETACVLGFLFFVLMFALIWNVFVQNSTGSVNWIIYSAFVLVWSIYGIVYMASEKTKNIIYNALDAIAKCFIGIFLWAYFTKVLVI